MQIQEYDTSLQTQVQYNKGSTFGEYPSSSGKSNEQNHIFISDTVVEKSEIFSAPLTDDHYTKIYILEVSHYKPLILAPQGKDNILNSEILKYLFSDLNSKMGLFPHIFFY